MATLDQEYAVYESRREELEASQAGKYALIKGDELIGAYDSLDDALRVAVPKFGRGPYLIKEIGLPEPESVFPVFYGIRP